MANLILGEITLFAGNFAPQGWALCHGQLLAISSNNALFSLLGTVYGGDGRTTFGLPDLRGRVPVHPGSGAGLPPVSQGEKFGAETVNLTTATMPSHSHAVTEQPQLVVEASTDDGNQALPAATHRPASAKLQGPGIAVSLYSSNTADTTLGGLEVSGAMSAQNAGQSTPQPHNNIQPSLALNYIIALVGVFPSRS